MTGFGVRLFVLLNRLFGLAPFDMSLAVMVPKVVSQTSSITLKLHQMMPTYLALCFYVVCLASIFWQNRGGTEITMAANWLQFIPNAFSYVVCLYVSIKNRKISAQILETFYACDKKMQNALDVSFRKYNKRANYLSYLAAMGILFFMVFLWVETENNYDNFSCNYRGSDSGDSFLRAIGELG